MGRNVDLRPLYDLEQRLLHPLAGHITGDARVVAGFAPGFVDLVDVDDALFGAFDVKVSRLEQAQQDRFHVLANIAGLGEGGRVGDGKGHVQDAGQRLGQQRFATAGRSDQQDIALLQLYVVDGRTGFDPLVVIIDGYREDLLGPLLAHDVLFQASKDLARRREFRDAGGRTLLTLLLFFLLENLDAQPNALVTDIDAVWSGNQPVDHFGASLAKRAKLTVQFRHR